MSWWARTREPAHSPTAAALAAGGLDLWSLDAASGVITWRGSSPLAPGPGPRTEPLADYLDRVHPGERESLAEAIRTASGADSFRVEHRVLCADGQTRWVELAGAPARAGAADITAIAIDVSARKRAQDIVQLVAAGNTAPAGDGSLQSMVAYICHTLRVDHAFIARLTDDRHLRMVARCVRGQAADGIEYPLAGTPCAEATKGPMCYYPTGVAERFPADRGLAAMGAQSYLGMPLRDASGTVLGVLSVTHSAPLEGLDTAKAMLAAFAARAGAELQRQRAIEALERQTSLLQSILTSIDDGVAVCDADSQITLINPAGRLLLGLPPAGPLPRFEALEFAPAPGGAPLPPAQSPIGRAIAGEHVHSAELVVRQATTGHEAWLDVTASPLVESGEGGAVAVLRDISERRRAEEALRLSEVRYRLLFEQSQALTFVVDADGVLLDLNEAAASSLGYRRADLLGKSAFGFIFEESRETARQALTRAFANVGPVSVDVDVRSASGERRSLLFAARHADLLEGGRVRGILVSALDITDRKRAEAERARLEEQVRQGQKMEAVGQLAGGVAHDFNNLLQAMLGYLHLALDELTPAHSSHRRLVEVVRAADRAAELTRRLLAFSRRQPIERRHIDPRRAVAEATNLLRRVIGEHIQLSLTGDGRASTILADPSQVEQVLLNLCVNARDAMPDGGTIAIDVRDEDVPAGTPDAAVAPGAYVCLRVSDTGFGISPDIRPHVFEPFFTTKGLGEGTGLGLATVYAIISGLGGAIVVNSVPGDGATFTIWLPRSTDTEVAAAAPADTVLPPGGGETLLVAEDEDLVRELLVEMLEGAGYQVVVARDGAEAVALFAANRDRVDGAIVDVVMPKLTGHQVHEAIAAERPDLPVLFASGYGFEAPDPSTPVIAKPYARADLLRRIRGLLDAAAARHA